MTPHEMATICRFSRNGHIPWQSVAVMLGRDRASLRAEYDSLSMVPVTLTPDNIGPVATLPEPECYRSPRPKGPNLRMSIIAALTRCRMSAETLAGLTATGIKPTRARLSQLQADGVVFHDGRIPYAWDLTEYGREVWRREQASRDTEEKAALPFDRLTIPRQEIANDHQP